MMQCLETTLGGETYFAILAVVVGLLMNGIKRIPRVPSDAIPVVAFVLGWSIDFAISSGSCGATYLDAALGGLGGGLAGLASSGGHEALSRTANMLGLGPVADRVLGKAKTQKKKRTKTTAASIVFLLVMLSGCAGLLPKLAQGAQYLDTVIDVADSGARVYFARHPNLDNERKVDTAVRRARGALAALNGALAAGSAEDVDTARTEALAAYRELRALLVDLGVLSATPPLGGSETDAPEPEPFALPEAEGLAL